MEHQPLDRALNKTSIYNQGSKYFNQHLQNAINSTYASGERPNILDIYTFMQAIENNPKKYDFTNITSMCSVSASDKRNCPRFLFWDIVHPTTQAHRDIATFVMDNI